MAAYHAYCALNASDVQCADYINIYSQQADAPKKTSDKKEVTLYDAVVRGLIDSAYQAAKKELETREPLAVIDEDLIPALDKVGRGIE